MNVLQHTGHICAAGVDDDAGTHELHGEHGAVWSVNQEGEKEARRPHHDGTQTLLARDELDGWPGLRP